MTLFFGNFARSSFGTLRVSYFVFVYPINYIFERRYYRTVIHHITLKFGILNDENGDLFFVGGFIIIIVAIRLNRARSRQANKSSSIELIFVRAKSSMINYCRWTISLKIRPTGDYAYDWASLLGLPTDDGNDANKNAQVNLPSNFLLLLFLGDVSSGL